MLLGQRLLALVAQCPQRSDDLGRTWQPASTGLTQPYVRWLVYHPEISDFEVAGTEPAGLFVSRDGAARVPQTQSLLAASSAGDLLDLPPNNSARPTRSSPTSIFDARGRGSLRHDVSMRALEPQPRQDEQPPAYSARLR